MNATQIFTRSIPIEPADELDWVIWSWIHKFLATEGIKLRGTVFGGSLDLQDGREVRSAKGKSIHTLRNDYAVGDIHQASQHYADRRRSVEVRLWFSSSLEGSQLVTVKSSDEAKVLVLSAGLERTVKDIEKLRGAGKDPDVGEPIDGRLKQLVIIEENPTRYWSVSSSEPRDLDDPQTSDVIREAPRRSEGLSWCPGRGGCLTRTRNRGPQKGRGNGLTEPSLTQPTYKAETSTSSRQPQEFRPRQLKPQMAAEIDKLLTKRSRTNGLGFIK